MSHTLDENYCMNSLIKWDLVSLVIERELFESVLNFKSKSINHHMLFIHLNCVSIEEKEGKKNIH